MTTKSVDVLLVGAGAMSTTLGMLLKQLDPSLRITMVERLDQVALESTDAMNNAGTGHAAYCELNYTPEQADGSINIKKAVAINSSFEISQQFWSYLTETGALPEPQRFINRVPHMSFVWGDKGVSFLRKRFDAMKAKASFAEMEYSEDPQVIQQWMPLVMNNRPAGQKIAATRVQHGTDVNFGELARNMVKHLCGHEKFELLLQHQVQDLEQNEDKTWNVELKDLETGLHKDYKARFVFLGAGGGSLPLLQKSGIPEGKGYGGFPVSGMWLVCKNQKVVEQHHAKVYGQAPIGAPPMSVPHLDTRIVNGKRALLFGPFAGFTTKFLKQGSVFDMFGSLKPNNLKPMLTVGMKSMDLTKYLISEVLLSHNSRCDSLRNFFPDAKDEDWELSYAGQRVQVIKNDPVTGGRLEFGTEVITSADGSLAALLGASPGASTTVSTMISIIQKCFPEQMESEAWQAKMKEMVHSYGHSVSKNTELLKEVRTRNLEVLGIKP